MPNFQNWLGNTRINRWRDPLVSAVGVANMIAERPVDITIEREDPPLTLVTLSAQSVRIDLVSKNPHENAGTNELLAMTDIVVLGYRNHPTIDDTDIRRGDRFVYDGQQYTIVQVLPDTPYSRQAVGRANQ